MICSANLRSDESAVSDNKAFLPLTTLIPTMQVIHTLKLLESTLSNCQLVCEITRKTNKQTKKPTRCI